MFQLAILSLFLTFTSGAFVPGEKIVGGVDTGIEDAPYQVALEWQGEQFCGGSIITPRHILSAAHCVYLMDVQDVTVRAGSSLLQTGGTVIQALNFTIHPNFTYWSPVSDYDVSIVELAEEIKITNVTQIIGLTDSEPDPGTYVFASGWGSTEQGGDSAGILQSVNMIVVDHEECEKIYQHSETVTEHMFCAGDVRGTCHGDSGGPVTKEGASGERFVAGIVSFSINGCAEPNVPGVFVSVAHPDIKKFILKTIGAEWFV